MVITKFAIKLLRDIISQSHFFFFTAFSRATQAIEVEAIVIYQPRESSLYSGEEGKYKFLLLWCLYVRIHY
ncbi:hypothetical protein ACJIZ3_008665 [Penstemon smallii]|uniref:Secreted protein n=1 Tax=Penstemon smallii TaxID=265156 RepID=A0ABD3TAH9_9LAMI